MKEDPEKIAFSRFRHDAVVFDLDGVVTRTAKVHAAAWKEMFDTYREESGGQWDPFDPDSDYTEYVDGKPRYDGVESFLNSRGLELPRGGPEDEPGKETVCGLGNLKNRLFRKRLQKDGVEVYESAVGLARDLRDRGFKIAVVSSSKNCTAVLKAAGIRDLFDVKVDGVDSEELGLAGKPAPDIFLEAARRLEAQPGRTVVLEDAISGVEAGKRGGFACVVGLDRKGGRTALRKAGADVVVRDLADAAPASRSTRELRSALDAAREIAEAAKNRTLAVFLDYDGTLTPIVNDPARAVLADSMRRAVRVLSERCTVGIISGRDLQDVKRLVGLEDLVYAGSHGFDIDGPEHRRLTSQRGEEFLPDLDRAEQRLRKALESIEGAQVERKRFSIAVHYRMVADRDHPAVEEAVDRVREDFPRLRKGHGKKVYELQPDLDWNKGKALLWILETLGLDSSGSYPLYVGDDVTDEYAFGAVRDRGLGIVVTEEPRFSEARYVLKNPDEVRAFLEELASLLKGGHV